MKKLALIAVMLSLSACGRNATELATQAEASTDSWIYSATIDKMDDSISRYAFTFSASTLTDEKGNDGSHVQITVHDPEPVTFTLTGDQFHCSGGYINDSGERISDSEACSVRIRFDDNKFQNFAAREFGDSNQWLSLLDGKRFLAEMMKAKNVRVELPIYDRGSPVVSFDISGFNPQKLAAAQPAKTQ